MNNLLKLYENQYDTIYVVNDKIQGLVDIPKNLKNNIKLFMIFKDDNLDKLHETEKQKLITEIINTSKKINSNNDEGLFVVAFIEDNILTNTNAFTYTNELYKIKSLVNNIYNKLLSEGKLKKENFIKKVELLYSDNRYKNFMDWLCLQDSSKFHANSYQELLNNNNTLQTPPVIQPNINNNMSIESKMTLNNTQQINNNISIQNVTQPNNTTPITETLTIGSVKPSQIYNDTTSSGGGPSNQFIGQSNQLAKPKILVKTLPKNNAAFINWSTIIFILTMSFVIGISLSIYLLNK